MIPATGWRAKAACLTADPEVFFPVGQGTHEAEDARQICAGCPVWTDCLDWVLERPEERGIWGGLTRRERRSVKRGKKHPYEVAQEKMHGQDDDDEPPRCQEGHEIVGDNALRNGSTPTGRQRYVCATCTPRKRKERYDPEVRRQRYLKEKRETA